MQILRSLGPGRLLAMAAVGLATFGFIGYLIMRVSTPDLELLYGDLNANDAKRIVSQLEDAKIPYELRDNGTSVWVPGDQKLKLRVQTAETLSGGASVGYEIFDNQSSLGATNFVQDLNLLRALEGELSRTIMAMENVKQARVHLVLPKREMFSREERTPSASVMIAAAGNLSSAQVQSIRYLVAAAVPKLEANQVAITDNRGRLLARPEDDEGQLMLNSTQEMKRDYEFRLARAIEEMVASTVGPGKVRAEVRAEMNFDNVMTSEEIYDAEQAVPRTTTTIEESSSLKDQETDPVTVANNLPDAGLNQNTVGTSSETTARTEETTDFAISKKVVSSSRQGGEIDRLSVAVMVDGVMEPDANGTETYRPRTDAEMEQIAALVRTAAGYDARRGDQIEVVNMRFVDPAEQFAEEVTWDFFGFTKSDIMKLAEVLGLAVVAVLVILLLVRPMLAHLFEMAPVPAEEVGAGGRKLLEGGPEQARLAGPGMATQKEDEFDGDELIDIDKIEGQVRASSLKKIGEIVEKHPDEALSIVRNWLYSETVG